jgi:hypothetical protein
LSIGNVAGDRAARRAAARTFRWSSLLSGLNSPASAGQGTKPRLSSG